MVRPTRPGEPLPPQAAGTTTPDEAAAGAALDSLKSLLLGAEQEQLADLRERLEDPDRRAADLAQVLPQALRRAEARELNPALELPLSGSIQQAVRREPKAFADALFPIIGPAIRRAIAEALKGLVQNLNRTLDHSLSLRGFRWRLEALRSGVPFGEVVLRHTLAYRVEQVFLIRPDDGLMLQHLADELATGRDADAVSAMLTAIQAFVRDAFAADDPVDSVDMGEHTVWLLHGPRAYMACVIRGLPPRRLRADLGDVLGDIHARYGDALAAFTGDRAALEEVRGELARCLVAEHKEHAAGRGGPSPALLLVLAGLLALLGWWGHGWWEDRAARQAEAALQAQAVARLRDTPGLVLTESSAEPGMLRLHGLRDPLAEDPVALLRALGLDAGTVQATWRPFHSAEAPIALARARRLLDPPAEVQLALDAGGVLRASGTAAAEWTTRATLLAAAIPGIERLDAGGLVSPDERLRQAAVTRLQPPPQVQVSARDGRVRVSGTAPAAWIAAVPGRLAGTPDLRGTDLQTLLPAERLELQQLRESVMAERLLFAEGGTLTASQRAALDALAPRLQRLAELAQALGEAVRVRVTGRTDGVGDPAHNLLIARERAYQTAEHLVRAGLPHALFELRAEPGRERSAEPDPALRRVDFAVELRADGAGE